MIQFDFGRLEQVELRTVWVSEDSDFASWISRSDSLAMLGEALNLELELENMEGWVSPSPRGVVCRTRGAGGYVVIANQLEHTDQSHLGQLLTYAAELKAVTMVWVAAQFTQEDQNTLNWLNEVTGSSIQFFGLEVELWRIGDSPLAPKFNVVCKPSGWTEGTPAPNRAESSTPPPPPAPEDDETTLEDQLQQVENELQLEYQLVENELQLEYWQALRKHLESSGSFIRPGTPRSQNWMNFDVGHWRLRMTAFNNMRDGGIGVQLVIREGDAEVSYNTLYQQRGEIGAEIGDALEWRELPEHKQGQVMLRRYNADPTNRAQWPEQHDWFKDKLESFDRAFRPRITTFNADD
ncbi:MAG: DUF4268 domain-containing protein [Caldilineaceae bacterium]|nr:DUF4268 domain-containing protein [Caldilineaceae bacterium]MCY4091277.1 DUF4268 domain-containing protein [Caldilineaceae bacterium]MDE0183140.1 DUF4268 domain-containing protein [Caldilineaceae bacterium]